MLDLAALVIGSLFVAIGVLACAVALTARPRVNRSAVWFGLFCVLYGVRLLATSDLLLEATSWPERFFGYVRADITYAILVPACLFVESIAVADRYHLLRRTWQVTAIAAAGAIVLDALREPLFSGGLNKALVVVIFVVWFWHFKTTAPKGPWSNDVRIVTAAGALLTVTALFETLSGGGRFGNVVVEPLAMLMFAGGLGWFLLTRARQQETSYAALTRELDLARSIQQSLLPQRMPDAPGLRLAGAYIPMSAVAGDFYDVLPLSSGRTLILVADVSGHGIPAALIASMVKVAVAAEADRHDSPGDILTGINRALTGKFERAYVTACCVVTDPQRRRLMYAVAGHPPALLRRTDGRIERLDQGGIVLTLMPAVVYQTTEVAFEPGDRLLIYTDGLTESTPPGGDEFFGDAELARVLTSMPASGDAMRALLDAHQRWIGDGTPVSDDISVVLVEHVGVEAHASR